MMLDYMPEVDGPHFDRGLMGADGRLRRWHKGGAEKDRAFKDLFARAIVGGKQTNGKRATPQQQQRALKSLGVNPAEYMTPAPALKAAAPAPASAPEAVASSSVAKRKRSGSLLAVPQYAGTRPMGGKRTLLG